MRPESSDLPVGTVTVSNGSFAWETGENRQACKEFDELLVQRLGPAKGKGPSGAPQPGGAAKAGPAEKGKPEGKEQSPAESQQKEAAAEEAKEPQEMAAQQVKVAVNKDDSKEAKVEGTKATEEQDKSKEPSKGTLVVLKELNLMVR